MEYEFITATEMNLNATQAIGTASYTTRKPLKPFIELITGIIPIAYIFECSPNETSTRLIIILDQYRFQRSEETKNIMEFLALSQINVELIYYSYGTLNDSLQRGNLFFATYCRRVNCVYQYTPDYGFIESSEITLAAMKSSSTAILKTGLEKVGNFFDGATAYLGMGKFHLSAFMLHQTCEQILKLIIKLFSGSDFKSHQLPLLQRNAGFYYPEIKNIFDAKENKESKWIELLQQAYVGARYDDDYKIEPQHLFFLQEKIALMLNKINSKGLLIAD